MMGGEIHVESRLHRGTAFTVELPVGELGKIHTPSGTQRVQPTPRAPDETIILHIDDDTSALELVKRLLDRPGRRVISTPEPEEGVEWMHRFQPDLVLLDIEMPRVSGWAILAQMQEDPQLRDLRTLVVSAEGEESVARALGARGMLRKPIDRKVLEHMVSSTTLS